VSYQSRSTGNPFPFDAEQRFNRLKTANVEIW